MLDLTSMKFNPKRVCLAANDPKEFGANVLGVAQINLRDLRDIVEEGPCEAYGFVRMAKDHAAKLRAELTLLEAGIDRVQPLVDEIDEMNTSNYSDKFEKFSKTVAELIPEEYRQSNKV